MSARPWYAWYPGDFAAKTRRLTLEQIGAYHRLLDEYYLMAEALSTNRSELHRVCGAITESERAAVEFVITRFFYEKSGRYRNKRADKELARQLEIADNLSRRGRAGSDARWGNKMPVAMPVAMLEKCLSDASEMAYPQPQPQTTATTISTISTGDGNKGVRGKSKFPIPADFAVSDRVRTWAEKFGYGQLEKHLENFRLQAEARAYAYANWDSAFMKAIAKDWAGLRTNGHDRGTETLSELLTKEQ